jgi:Gas vesicle protein
MQRLPTVAGPTSLMDILDRVLDKGLVVAGDVRISLANVELLTIRIRLLVCSVDKAEQIGLNWWKNDPNLTAGTATPVRRTLPGPPPGAMGLRPQAIRGKQKVSRKSKGRRK